MARESRRRPASEVDLSPKPSGVEDKSPWTLLALAVVLGPIVYIYTKQWGRLALFSALLVLAFFGSFFAAFVHYVREEDLAALTAQDPAGTAWLLGKVTAWVLVAVGAVLVACVADVWWQAQQASRD